MPSKPFSPRQTIQTVESTGTPYGIGSWMVWLGCPRQAALAAERSKSGLTGQIGLDVGTVGHALLELYYYRAMRQGAAAADRIDTSLIKWTDPAGHPQTYQDEVYREADRAFRAYRLRHPANEFGKPVEVERMYTLTDFYGVPTFTFRPDLEVKLTRSRALALGLHEAGYYLVDHKFYGWQKEDENDRLLADLRFTAYHLAYERTYPRRKLQGIIPNIIYKTKTIDFNRPFIPPPGKTEVARLQHALTLAARVREENLLNPLANPFHCIGPFRICRFFGKECLGL